MPLPVIAETFRVTFNWAAVVGVTAHNVLYFQSVAGDEAQLAADIDAELSTNMLYPLNNGVTLDSVDIIALDGVSATQHFAIASAVTGSGTGEIVPAAAAIINLHTLQRGPRGRGRIFLGPVTEDKLTNGMLAGSTAAVLQAAWTDFIADMAATAAQWSWKVVSAAHADAHSVQTIGVRAAAGTLRRRQDQLVH